MVGQATVAAAPPADIRVLPDAVAAFVEVAAARSSRRAGLPEAHFLSLLSAVLGAPSGPLLWLTARAYVEAGFFDVLTPRRWPSRTYAACPPRFVAWTDAHGPAVSLVGLAPAWLRRQTRTKADALGLIEATPTPVSSLVPSPLVFRGPTPSALAALASAMELPSPADLVPLSELCAPPTIVADAASIVAPEFHVSAGVWSWTRGGFHAEPTRRRLASPDSDVMLRRLVHPRAPTQYAVEADGVAPRFFRGDAWARLWALALRGAPAFAPDTQGRLVRASPSPVHLPVPVARALATVAGAPGPTTGADGWPGYANPTTPEALAAILAVWGNACRHVSPSAAARARALAQRVQTAVGPRVPVSRVLARRLAPFGHDASVATMLSGGLPVHLVPHLTVLARALDSTRP